MKMSLGGSDIKDLLGIQETWVQSLDQEDPLKEGNGYQLQYSCLQNSMNRGAGYSPWGHKELDTAERLTLYFPE